jgi:hypothetical protein
MTPERSSASVVAAAMDLPTAAAYAGVAIAVLARAIHRREVPFWAAAGGTLYVERAALETWAEQRASGS